MYIFTKFKAFNTNGHTCTHTRTHMHACTHARTHTRKHIHTHTLTCMHAHTHTHTHTHTELYIRAIGLKKKLLIKKRKVFKEDLKEFHRLFVLKEHLLISFFWGGGRWGVYSYATEQHHWGVNEVTDVLDSSVCCATVQAGRHGDEGAECPPADMASGHVEGCWETLHKGQLPFDDNNKNIYKAKLCP